jgi:hypothetical protein
MCVQACVWWGWREGERGSDGAREREGEREGREGWKEKEWERARERAHLGESWCCNSSAGRRSLPAHRACTKSAMAKRDAVQRPAAPSAAAVSGAAAAAAAAAGPVVPRPSADADADADADAAAAAGGVAPWPWTALRAPHRDSASRAAQSSVRSTYT